MKPEHKAAIYESAKKAADAYIAFEESGKKTDTVTKRYERNNAWADGDMFYRPLDSDDECVSYVQGVKVVDDVKLRKLWNDQAGQLLDEDIRAPEPGMRRFAVLPFGHICYHCGGSMLAIIQMDEDGLVLKTDVIDAG